MSRAHQDLHTNVTGVSQPDMFRTALAKSRQIHVGIVGAGFAGLRCADVLLKQGFKVTILEARERVGGRVGQSNHLGHLVDLYGRGPNWIHGVDGNPILDIAKQTGTTLAGLEEEQAVFRSDGKPMDPESAAEYGELVWVDGLMADAFKYSTEHAESIDPQRSLYDYWLDKVNGMFTDLPAEAANLKRKELLQVSAFWGSYIGTPVQRQSLRFFWLEETVQGENPFVAGTYQKILGAVAKQALESADIKYRTVVKKISYQQKQPQGGERDQCVAETASGQDYRFDEIVVTTPLGWLKNNKSVFEPPLPQRLLEAIDNVGYGNLDKVYINFPVAFWEKATSDRSVSARLRDGLDPHGTTPNVKATTAPVHQPATDISSDHHPGFTHWLEPEYAPDTNPKQWHQQGMNLAALSEGSEKPTILFYIYGDCARHIGELVKTAKSDAERDAELYRFFAPYYSRLPGYEASSPECQPKAALATAWSIDEFAGYGSYSNFQVGVEKCDEDIETMRYGVPEQGLWFAGEHTAPFHALATSTGAYMSGEALARRLCNAYSIEVVNV